MITRRSLGERIEGWVCFTVSVLMLAAFLAFCATYAYSESLPPKPRADLERELRELQAQYNALEDKMRVTPQCRRYWTNGANQWVLG